MVAEIGRRSGHCSATTSVVILTALMVCTCMPAGCKEEKASVVVYCSVDEAYARKIFAAYEQKTGVRVAAVYDTEAGKTTGLVNKIRAERGRPRADVLFSGEIFNTIRLADEGLLAVYDSPSASDIPSQYVDSEHRWTGIAVRQRVLAYSRDRVDPASLPKLWREVSELTWASRMAHANPLFGTTRGHVGAMVSMWGRDGAEAFLRGLKEHGALMVDGNASAVRAIIDGRVDLCMTDTDDVYAARASGYAIDMVFPHMLTPDGGGGETLSIPSSVALIQGAKHPEAARRLVDFLVSAEVEQILHDTTSRNLSVRTSNNITPHMAMTAPTQNINYNDIAAAMPIGAELTREILIR